MQDIIRGAGGGGKSGGGGASSPEEAPDSLQSVQYAKVLDLVSEGEIGGLVNGLNSIYINETPLLNDNGKYNFSGVSVDYRYGTQSQTYIPNFPAVENEVVVGAEVKKALPVVRTITNPNISAARITVSVPGLSEQSTSTGDINGTSVTLRVHYQNNGGGYIPARISQGTTNLTISGTTASSNSTSITSASIGINWVGVKPPQVSAADIVNGLVPSSPIQRCNYRVDYKLLPAGAWTPFYNGVFSGTPEYKLFTRFTDLGEVEQYYDWVTPTGANTVALSGITEGAYSLRVVITSGSGTLSIKSATGATWTPDITITGKTTSKYQRSVRIPLPSPGPWDIRVTRVTDDSATQVLQNRTFFDSFTEIIDSKLSYPNSAVFGLKIDARQFNSIPSRSYEIYGIKVKIPDNYDPVTREYTGEWAGNFVTEWTDNPAWIFYDLVTNTRYGLGEFIDTSNVDKWALYAIAQYCDGLVPTGLGGLEPRFTCNTFIQTRSEAISLITQLASVFRSMVFWSAGQITCVQDRPSTPVALFSAANVIDGQFNYSGSSVKTRHTVCLVTWNDPRDMYRQKVEYVEDQEGIRRYGVVQTEVLAFACTSRGQAHRVGNWLLLSERLEAETVNFKAGMDAALIYPGAIILTQDSSRSGKRFGGRTFNSTASTIQLDSQITIESGKTYELSLVLPDGTVETRNVTTSIGSYSAVDVSPSFSSAPSNGAVWVVSASDLKPEEWRVVSISERDAGVVEISALASRQDKYAAIENNLQLEPIDTTSIGATAPNAVENISITEALYLITETSVGNSVIVSWESSAASFLVSYETSTLYQVTTETRDNSFTFNGILPGQYTFSVQPIDALGRRGEIASVTTEIYGLSSPPADVNNFNLSPIAGAAHITFDPATDLDVRVGGNLRLKHSKSGTSWNDAIDIGVFISGTSTSAVVPLLQGSYFAKWVDSSGTESVNAVVIETNAPSIINLNFVESVIEHPAFDGVKTGVGIDTFAGNPCITLDSQLTIDEMTASIDSWPMFMAWGGVINSGEYLFNAAVDLGSIYTSRITADLQSFGYNPSDSVDAWPLLDSLLSVDGDVISDVSATIFIRQSDDNVTFSGWTPLFVGDYTARAFEFKLVLSSLGSNSIAVTQCAVNVDMPDTVQASEDIVSGTATYSVVYPNKYYSNPAIGITAQNMQTGDYYVITNKTNLGFDIVFKNSAGTNISRTFDYISKGY